MPGQKILFVTTEMSPYQEDSAIAESVNRMALKMHREGNDVRVLMPRFGQVSERRFQLHEVIRLSGMNIIINDLDQPLIIKVASLPGERLQVYFIDNEEYFKRKAYYLDAEGEPFEDNLERAVFFARGVIETVKKLNWVPDVIHLNGWMSAVVLVYLKTFYKKDFYFNNTKLVLSLYNEPDFDFAGSASDVLKFDKIPAELSLASVRGTLKAAAGFADVLLQGDEFLEGEIQDAYEASSAQKGGHLDADAVSSVY